MFPSGFRPAFGAAVLVCASASALAESVVSPVAEPDIVVTPSRAPQPIQRAGSAITVVRGEEIEKASPLGLADALRGVPGLDLTETGGPGATSSVRLRGANAGQTLVLIDGVRVGDPSGVANDFDFSTFIPGAIERIEVLRGPQSALYGSDAMGGVVNVITRRGKGPMQATAAIEGGSYGALATTGGVFGSQGPWSYAFSGGWQKSSGFSRYGYRIGRIERAWPNPEGLEADSMSRWGAYGRIGHDAGQGVRLEFGALASTTFAQYDAAFGVFPDTPSLSERRFGQAWAKAAIDSFADVLTHNFQLFANRTERRYRDFFYLFDTSPGSTFLSRYEYAGNRTGAEYQGDLRLGSFGLLSFGARIEREAIATHQADLSPFVTQRQKTLGKDQTTRSAFALWQLPLGERLDLSFSGRIDDVSRADVFRTWRATAAFRLPEINTKLRASAGAGGKAPTLYQLHAPFFGNARLQSEESIGYDAGFDTDFFGGRARLSATAFANRFRNMIDFDLAAFRFINVARAATSGVELAGSAEVAPDLVTIRATYTYLHAKDRLTGLTLVRRPQHMAKLGFALTPLAGLSIEPALTLVSERFSNPGEVARLAPYARLDIRAEYRIDRTWAAHARVENVTGAKYQEAQDFGTTGRAFYAGLKANW
jgi:vitamin B12 transporter